MAETATLTRPAAAAGETLLSVRDLQGWYGESHVLHGIEFDVRPGEVVTLLGRNGAGKTTTLKAVMGILPKRTGSVTFDGREIISLPSRTIARAGIAFCPEERAIFSSLSVEENLLLLMEARARRETCPSSLRERIRALLRAEADQT